MTTKFVRLIIKDRYLKEVGVGFEKLEFNFCWMGQNILENRLSKFSKNLPFFLELDKCVDFFLFKINIDIYAKLYKYFQSPKST